MSEQIKKRQKYDLTVGPVFKKLLLFSLPILGSHLIQQLYNTVDIFFAGNFINTGAMAAVGASGMIVTLLVGFFNGMSVGSSVTISHAFGSHNHDYLSRALHSAVGIAILGGVGISVLGFFSSPLILRVMNTPDDIIDMATSYIQIYFCSVVSLVFYNIGTGILRATGNSKMPMIYQCIGGGINVLLDYLFIVVFAWGVNGVALATLFSQTIPAILVFLELVFAKDHEHRIHITKIRIHFDILKSILKIGIPAGIQSIVITLSNMIVQSQINGFQTNAIAAFTAYFRVELIMYLPIVAYGQSVTTFVGQNFGAKKLDRVQKGIRLTLLMGIITTFLTSSFVMVFAPMCFSIFDSDPDVVNIGLQFIYINASLYFVYNFIEVFSGALRGSGNSLVPMIITVGNMCGIRILALFIMISVFHTVQAVAVCYPITWITTSICLIIYYSFGKLGKQIRDYNNKSTKSVEKHRICNKNKKVENM